MLITLLDIFVSKFCVTDDKVWVKAEKIYWVVVELVCHGILCVDLCESEICVYSFPDFQMISSFHLDTNRHET